MSVEKIAKIVSQLAKSYKLTQSDNLNFMIGTKASLLLKCEKEFQRDIPNHKLREMKTLDDVITYYSTPVLKTYHSGLPSLEEGMTASPQIANIKIYEDVAPPVKFRKKNLRVY